VVFNVLQFHFLTSYAGGYEKQNLSNNKNYAKKIQWAQVLPDSIFVYLRIGHLLPERVTNYRPHKYKFAKLQAKIWSYTNLGKPYSDGNGSWPSAASTKQINYKRNPPEKQN
jgi:hypothetical protein